MEMHLVLATLVGTGLCAMWDVKTGRIPNVFTFSCILAGVAINTWCSGFDGFWSAFYGIIVGVLLLIIPFAFGGIGAGDVKMLAAIGALNGSKFVFQAFLFGAVAGGLIALVATTHKSVYAKRKSTIPYGMAIFLGTLIAYMTV
jgi:prepilin peptidase CpaA